MSRSVNKVIIIGNLTRDPEMRYTPDGQAVTSFGVATNRRWKSKEGEQKEDVEFHNLVAWGKLAELCSQLLKKGRKVYLEGRLQTRSWEGKDGVTRQRTEIVLEDMVLLDSKGAPMEEGLPEQAAPPEEEIQLSEEGETEKSSVAEGKKSPEDGKAKGAGDEEVSEDEIPF
uniref:Single-stranded DNA-binding protein n=1 Tax=candidate division WWE3 bacterium TaxID=2053526 RepID=A0A831YQ24_UNCKA